MMETEKLLQILCNSIDAMHEIVISDTDPGTRADAANALNELATLYNEIKPHETNR